MTAQEAKELYELSMIPQEQDMTFIYETIERIAKGNKNIEPARKADFSVNDVNNRIAEKLRMNGYTCKLHSDQREGTWWEVTW